MHSQLGQLFSLPVAFCVADESMWRQPLYPEEQSYTQGMVEKRLAEFRAGRACARQVLLELGVDAFPILRNVDRAPLWPDGIVGSISHCDDVCWAAAVATSVRQSLGIDVEHLHCEMNISPDLVCVDKELAYLSQHPGQQDSLLMFFFSAKESVIKAYYSATQLVLNFLDICLRLDECNQCFQVEWIRDSLIPRSLISGRYLMTESHIYTAVDINKAALKASE